MTMVDYTSLMDAYPGFDWFSTSIFFLMGCDDVRTWRWLRTFSLLLPSAFLWHARLFNTVRSFIIVFRTVFSLSSSLSLAMR